MATLKQAGMIAVLALLSEGFLFLHRSLAKRADSRFGLAAELFAGAVSCSSGLALLRSAGTRDEK